MSTAPLDRLAAIVARLRAAVDDHRAAASATAPSASEFRAACEAVIAAAGIDDPPQPLPALMRAETVTIDAARAGFDWPNVRGPLAKIREELDELLEAIGDAEAPSDTGSRGERVASELGDLLFATVNAARHLRVAPEDALHGAIDRFAARFDHVRRGLAADGRGFDGADPAELDARWATAKGAVG